MSALLSIQETLGSTTGDSIVTIITEKPRGNIAQLADSTSIMNDGLNSMLHQTRISHLDNWAIATLVFLFILLATIRIDKANYLGKLFQSVFNISFSLRLFNEKVNYLSHVAFRLDLLYFLTFGFYIYHFATFHHLHYRFEGFQFFVIATLGLFLFSIIKTTLYSFSGSLFGQLQLAQSYRFFMKQSRRISAIVLLIIDVLLFVQGYKVQAGILIFGAITLLFFFAVAALKVTIVFLKKDISIIYLILYLCCLEFLPLLLLWKILWRGNL